MATTFDTDIAQWARLAGELGMASRGARPAEVFRHPDFLARYPWLAGWRIGDLDPESSELIPGGPNPAYVDDPYSGAGPHRINRVAPGRARRPALLAHRFDDVFLVARSARLSVFRDGVFHAHTGAIVVDPSIRRLINRPDFEIDSGAYCGAHNRSTNPAHLVCDHLARAVTFMTRLSLPADRLWLETGNSRYAGFAAGAVMPGFQSLQAGACYRFRRLYLLSDATSPGDRGHPFWFMQPDLHAAVRAALLAALPPPGRSTSERIYLARFDTDRRPLLNERELAHRLEGIGFRVLSLSTLPPAEQLAAVRDARLIVAPHGGALGNLIAASAGTRVLELLNPQRGTACFEALARAAGARYGFCFGDPAPDAGKDAWRIGIPAVLRALENHRG